MKKAVNILFFTFLLSIWGSCLKVTASVFIHPGGLHTMADLDRMKTKVAENAHPWIDSWNKLIVDPLAQNSYKALPQANMGVSRQRASTDAHAAYLNAIRWYISGDVSYADCAIKICNDWSSTVNQIPTGNDIPGLSGIPISEFAMVAELLRISDRWTPNDFARFKNMMLKYWYPVCHGFLTNHNGACISTHWSNWDICNMSALISIGVLCDDTTIYNEGVEYFKNGEGMGSIMNAVCYLHSPTMGQWQESNRDQEHAQLAVGMMAALCQVTWNQGLDLYGYSNNRLLAGAEYVAKYNLWQPVPYVAYNNCKEANQSWPSINGRGRLDDRPVWEMIYNHYVVRRGLDAPYVKAMAQLIRPEHGSPDHFGYGTLTFTLNAAGSPYPPSPIPLAPTDLTATPGVGKVFLKWTSSGLTTQGYNVLRATTSHGPYATIYSGKESTACEYTDTTVANGATYYYVVSANNQSGTSRNSNQVSAVSQKAGKLPAGWGSQDIGNVSTKGSATYANVNGGTFVVSGSGVGISGRNDGFNYAYKKVVGDVTISARISDFSGSLSKTGIMMRESLAPNAKAVVMKLGDIGKRQAGFGTRSIAGGSMSWIGGNDYTWLPAWFKLQRVGNLFTAYESTDGIIWIKVGSNKIDMSKSFYLGLSVCSGKTQLNTTTFDNITISVPSKKKH